VLGLAHHEAHLYGNTGRCIVGTTAVALDEIDRDIRNAGPTLQVGKYRVSPNYPLLGKLGRVGGHIGYRVGVAALREKLGMLGVGPPVVSALEAELNREGLSLGPLAQPAPMTGTFA